MDLYIIDEQWIQRDVIDTFDSLIWTDRYNSNGDVTLVAPSTRENRDKLVEGIFLSTPGSLEAMFVDTVSDEEGKLTLTGESTVSILKQRLVRDTWSTSKDSWQLTGSAGNIANQLVTQMLTVSGLMGIDQVIPVGYGYYETLSSLSVVTEPTGRPSITVAVPYGILYDAVKMVCDLDNLGFTLYPSDQFGSTEFMVYLGRDLTTDQSTYDPVIFDPALDTLANVKTLRSLAGYMTAAYVFPQGMTAQSQVGYASAPGTDLAKQWNRRSMMVDASDINVADYTPSALTAAVTQRAKDALANNNYVRMSDGQLVPQGEYEYGIDYTLGDVIELRDASATTQKARVIEYIRSQDDKGERAYPTLSVIT